MRAFFETMVQMQIGKVEEAIATLEDALDPMHLANSSEGLLVSAYQMHGDLEKADSFAQLQLLFAAAVTARDERRAFANVCYVAGACARDGGASGCCGSGVRSCAGDAKCGGTVQLPGGGHALHAWRL